MMNLLKYSLDLFLQPGHEERLFILYCFDLATSEVFRQRNVCRDWRASRRLVKHCASYWRSVQGVYRF